MHYGQPQNDLNEGNFGRSRGVIRVDDEESFVNKRTKTKKKDRQNHLLRFIKRTTQQRKAMPPLELPLFVKGLAAIESEDRM